ncbi:FmdB family zinc ribbon protein [Steroidobacter cummioxidans]|uniref:FmdB family zinc ribbon protein n=1 Tax=Steroidobacter cummioxidans TaxID=1803913 RepID=UPI000E323FAD|nr:zinc ribbon domain-containing protein [Steroidobacter cummioxidans]
MPFYEYECSNCKFYVETLQKISDEPLRKCPSCKKSTLKKLISAPVFRLKGAGWYETDFKSEGEDKRNLADRDEPAEKAEDKSSSDTKAEAKADKPEKKPAKAEVSTGGGKKAAAKAAPAKGKKSAAKAPAKRPAPKKAAPAKKKAKRR